MKLVRHLILCDLSALDDSQKLHTPETHVKLLKKLKTSVQGLDYKKLMSGEDSEATLYVAITSANGHVLAKMANKFPQQAREN